ncbi:MAG: Spy/CpxP family protein refolding chaperone [Cyanobacteria bacterium]|nr:Spy/CpxP family protein refolding chaperone [Cyanobacteriota bacterium]
MKATRYLINALAVSILLSGFSMSYADPGNASGTGHNRFSGGFGGDRGDHGQTPEQMKQRRAEMEGRLQKMGVSSEQLQQFKTMHEQNRQQAQALKEQIQQRRQEFMQYMHSPNADEGTALAKQQELGQLMNQMHEMRIRSVFQMKKLLTPEQFQKLMERKQQAASGLGQRFQGKGLQGRGAQGAGGGRFSRRFTQRGGSSASASPQPGSDPDSGL